MSQIKYVKYEIAVTVHRIGTGPNEISGCTSITLQKQDYTETILSAIKDGILDDSDKAIADWVRRDVDPQDLKGAPESTDVSVQAFVEASFVEDIRNLLHRGGFTCAEVLADKLRKHRGYAAVNIDRPRLVVKCQALIARWHTSPKSCPPDISVGKISGNVHRGALGIKLRPTPTIARKGMVKILRDRRDAPLTKDPSLSEEQLVTEAYIRASANTRTRYSFEAFAARARKELAWMVDPEHKYRGLVSEVSPGRYAYVNRTGKKELD